MKPFIYPFENPSITAGLAAINATEPPFIVEAKHLKAWFKEGIIAHYMLVDDIRELWNREGFGALFEQVYGDAKNYTLIASCRADMEWTRAEEAEIPTYGVFCIDTAESLYTSCNSEANVDGNAFFHNSISVEIPLPEPVLPRYEAEKIYNLIHGKPLDDFNMPVGRISGKQIRALFESLEAHGFTENDFKGSIKKFQQKAANKKLGATLTSIDKNTLSDWLSRDNRRK
ncbi:hypothetical protein AB6F65_20250 [Providencia hangzhouensis]|uniref:hypothetical protein n=1 Tax=Providencia hangzhouensis TaxID=3031799 RepID=UPI0034DCD910